MKRPRSRKKSAKKAKKPAHDPLLQATRRLQKGLQSRIERVVSHEWTIAAYDPRLPAVLSTPAMIGLMEVAAAQAIQPHLPEGTISVGTRIEVDHLKALPPGATLEASAKLARSQGRFLVFEAEAVSDGVVIGRGRVFRAIVPLAKYSEKRSKPD